MLLAVLAVSFGEALLARGMKQSGQAAPGFVTQLLAVAANRHVLGGTFLMMLYFGLYMLALRRADLSFVLPITALSYLIGACLAKYYLGESVTSGRWIGAVIITIGVIIVGLAEPAQSVVP